MVHGFIDYVMWL